MAGPAVRPEPAPAQLVDSRLRHGGMWPVPLRVVRCVRMPEIDLHDGTVGIEHVQHRRRDPGPIHPVEGLAEADDAERAEGGGKVLSSHLHPGGAVDSFIGRCPSGLGHHAGIGVQADDPFEQACEQEGNAPWSAADVEESALTVQDGGARRVPGRGRGRRACGPGGSRAPCLRRRTDPRPSPPSGM